MRLFGGAARVGRGCRRGSGSSGAAGPRPLRLALLRETESVHGCFADRVTCSDLQLPLQRREVCLPASRIRHGAPPDRIGRLENRRILPSCQKCALPGNRASAQRGCCFGALRSAIEVSNGPGRSLVTDP